MDQRSAELFLHLCNSLHFARTSEQMHVSPSTLSRVIARLEDELGARLFTRDKRSVSLTPSGVRVRRFVEQWLGQWRELQTDLCGEIADLAGELSVYCSVTASYSHLPQLLDRFRILCPRAEIKLLTGDVALAVAMVRDARADIALAARPESLPLSVNFASMTTVPLSIIAPRVNCVAREMLDAPIVDWQRVPFILPEHGPARRRLEHWFALMNIDPPIVATVAGHEALVSMVALGSGAGIAPDVVLANSPVSDRIQKVRVDVAIEPFDMGVCALSKRLHEPLLQRFWQLAAHHPFNHD
ncbi:HTH-type transcriptional activator IlvY [Celerinatantimonas diazotrophica]|uniref:LysR family transcriptional regulator n=1 Tax=Celerinatantimonas diazotrophica TaxID=412034 RepID=A0A4R1J8N9_9GAMM|nr:HTH-type transcriptional activator IlvY [Celerinatantimonas diazotrophica]TCK46704.1 LysR family transcriptional regulator [Celerinatantimonas diazotrophica]CAG9295406.1 HTH-type transcriptional regulator CysB [Celerinatantimonas diazotrophica]